MTAQTVDFRAAIRKASAQNADLRRLATELGALDLPRRDVCRGKHCAGHHERKTR